MKFPPCIRVHLTMLLPLSKYKYPLGHQWCLGLSHGGPEANVVWAELPAVLLLPDRYMQEEAE